MNPSHLSNFSEEEKAKTTVQTHLPNETFVDIFEFLPNDDIILSVVMVSRRFSEIPLSILRKRFAGATSSWVKQFENANDRSVLFHNKWIHNNVALYKANINNGSKPMLIGQIWIKTFHPRLRKQQVFVRYKCLYDLENGDGEEVQFEAKHNVNSCLHLSNSSMECFSVYDFKGPVPINTNRNSRLHLKIHHVVGWNTYIDNNGGQFYVFTSDNKKGLDLIVVNNFKLWIGQIFIYPFRFCWRIVDFLLGNAFQRN